MILYGKCEKRVTYLVSKRKFPTDKKYHFFFTTVPKYVLSIIINKIKKGDRPIFPEKEENMTFLAFKNRSDGLSFNY